MGGSNEEANGEVAPYNENDTSLYINLKEKLFYSSILNFRNLSFGKYYLSDVFYIVDFTNYFSHLRFFLIYL